MHNQYQAIGRLIMNLRNGRFLEESDEFLREINEEFNEITLQLGHYWLERLDGWAYNLDFHRYEAERLRGFVDFDATQPSAASRLFLYDQLTEQMRRLDMMIDGVEVGDE